MDYREMKKEHAEHTLKVVGHGKVELMPDEVEIVFFLQQQDKSFVKAQTKVKDVTLIMLLMKLSRM